MGTSARTCHPSFPTTLLQRNSPQCVNNLYPEQLQTSILSVSYLLSLVWYHNVQRNKALTNMEQLAASRLKSNLRRHVSSSGGEQLRSNEDMPRENGSTVRDTVNEHSRLLSHNADDQPLNEDSRKWVRWPSETAHTVYKVLASNYVNVLLVFVPLGIIAGAVGWSPTAVFVLNFLAIIPLAALLSFATEELSVKLGQTLGGLLNATFGNAVELIVGVLQPGNRGRC